MPFNIPLATYRLQLTKDFGFDDAARIAPYLKSLGITHLYTSPFLSARPGSTHGYDIVDHRSLNPEFGGDAAFARLSEALHDHGLGLILDFVPNHMAVGPGNRWWLDTLEWGQKSPHAASFDISWDLLPHRKIGGVLLPVLGKPYGDAIKSGELKLKYDKTEGTFSVWYYQNRFPINPGRYSDILRTVVTAAGANDLPAGRELLGIANHYATLDAPSYRQAPELKRQLASIQGASTIIERGLSAYCANHESGVSTLHRLLERQHYRLADWHMAMSSINYRRFFDVNELAGLRVEDAGTFQKIHELIAQLIADGRLHGLRLDHIDGLLDPAQYTRRLQQLIRGARGAKARKPFYVVIEKIVAEGEELPKLSGVAGTTGYEWLNTISLLLVDQNGHNGLAALWRDLEPRQADFKEVLDASKRRVLDTIMASEFNVLVELLSRIAAGHFATRDYAADRLREALRLYVLEFPVYRTYITAAGCTVNDRTIINRTITAARRRWVGRDADIFLFLRAALTLDLLRDGLPYSRPRVRNFALKMQQFTGPMAAKSLEDTAFYRYQALLGSNEVGSHPTQAGISIAEFHNRMVRRNNQSPHGLTATATHDTKRGEDARTRILAISEMSDVWSELIADWRQFNAGFSVTKDGKRTPSVGHEYMLYQTMIGAWPLQPIDDSFTMRIEEYAIKAAREGKLETSWINPDENYENGLRQFIRAMLDHSQSAPFLKSLDAFARRAALMGALSSLSQLALKATIPGVPDFYQGTEFWDLSLVDPDNRRPVNFTAREESLEAASSPDWTALAEHWHNGGIKMALTFQLLRLRNELAEVFTGGGYEPIEVTGPDRNHIIAYRRFAGQRRVLIIVARHFAEKTNKGERWSHRSWHFDLRLDSQDRACSLDALRQNVRCDSEMSKLLETLPVAVIRS